MYYSDINTVKNYLPAVIVQQLTDDNDIDQIDVEKLNYALQQATDVIDGYLRGRYPVPLTGVIPFLITDLCTKLAVYFLIQRSLIITMPDPVKDQYTNSISMLKEMQRGKVNAFEAGDEPVFFKTNKSSCQRIFTNTPTVPAVTPSMTSTNQTQGQYGWGSYII
jgi:phage gp36-like protein